MFESQCTSSTTAHAPIVCTQESRNVDAKLKVFWGRSDSCYMCDAEDVEMEEGKRQREEEVEEE